MTRDPQEETAALYVRLPKAEADKLDRAAFELGAHKRDLVAGLVARYVDPATPEGLDQLRALGAPESEVPAPPEQERGRASLREPTLAISPASNWVAGMQTEIREFASSRRCTPLVRVKLSDGDEFFLRAMSTGPGDEYLKLSTYPLRHGLPRPLIVRLDAITKIELFDEAPGEKESEFVFEPRKSGVGFTGSE